MRPRPITLWLVAGVLALSAGGALSGCGSGSDQSSGDSLQQRLRGLDGIPQDGFTLGAPRSPATLVIYAYVTTPAVASFTQRELPTLVERFVKPGKLAVRLRTVVSRGDDEELDAASLLQAAGLRDRLWQTLLVFEDSYVGALDDLDATSYLRQAGVTDRAAVLKQRSSTRIAKAISRATTNAAAFKLKGALGYLLLTPGDKRTTIAPTNVVDGVARALATTR